MPDAGVGGVTYQLYLDGSPVGSPISQTSTTIAASLLDGAHTWKVRGCDALANCTESGTRSFNVDTMPPTAFSTTTPADGACTSLPTPSLCWTASSDPSGIAKYQLWVDGILNVDNLGPSTTCTTPSSALAQGAHGWFIVAFDPLGHSRASSTGTSASSTIIIDWQPPTTFGLVAPANASTVYTLKPAFQWTASSDPGGLDRYELWVDGVALASNISPASLSFTPASPLSAGSHPHRR